MLFRSLTCLAIRFLMKSRIYWKVLLLCGTSLRTLRTVFGAGLHPLGDALRVKQGLRLPSETELRQLLEDLGG